MKTPGKGRLAALLTAAAIGSALALTAPPSFAQQMKFFRIASGAAGGTYLPMAGMLANAISNPPGSRPCDKGGSCGVPGLVAVAQSANGSVANVNVFGEQIRDDAQFLERWFSLEGTGAGIGPIGNIGLREAGLD